jgi:hypothetical protein
MSNYQHDIVVTLVGVRRDDTNPIDHAGLSLQKCMCTRNEASSECTDVSNQFIVVNVSKQLSSNHGRSSAKRVRKGKWNPSKNSFITKGWYQE